MTSGVNIKGEPEGSPLPGAGTMNPRQSFSAPINGAGAGGPASIAAQKPFKPPVVNTSRVDVEPIYTQLKSLLLSDQWQLYKQTVAEFVIGKRNMSEMIWIIEPFIKGDPQKESLHNHLILAIFTNSHRDPPESLGLATWVSASDKPRIESKAITGDLAEQKLKTKIMELPPRERRRIRNLPEESNDRLAIRLQAEAEAIRMTLPNPQNGVAGTGSLAKTNWEAEIQKRYSQQLFVEANEFPDAEAIRTRMLPVCYENGIFRGFTPSSCDYLTIATENYIKDVLSQLFSSTRTNGIRWVKTAAYKRRIIREDRIATANATASEAAEAAAAAITADAATAAATTTSASIAVPSSTSSTLPSSLATGAAAAAGASITATTTVSGVSNNHAYDDSTNDGEDGVIRRNAAGLLPCEVEAERNRPALDLDDLTLALKLDSTPWGRNAPRTLRFWQNGGGHAGEMDGDIVQSLGYSNFSLF